MIFCPKPIFEAEFRYTIRLNLSVYETANETEGI
jgi:hypothetical protein